jgi:TonB family protein
MESPRPWQRSTPWLRVWPAAVLVVALHIAALHEWLVSSPGLQRLEPMAASIAVRILAPPPPSPPAAAAVPLSEPAQAPAAESRAASPTPPRGAPQVAAPQVAALAGASSAPQPSAPVPTVPPESDYLASSRLDPRPQLLEEVEPIYPPEAGLTEGSVVLRLLISRSGAVDEVTVVRSRPQGVFDRSAVAAFSAARFSPGMVLGVPVKSQMTLEVHFTPVDRGGNVSPPTY